ncbi:hypothetical protein QBC43DRAFT_357576 [Cladorrhinum sp. PSN259]|nr:hypothetical protein QBC43DRAFT_357576 [Cladorrhinum sp. PSN259]
MHFTNILLGFVASASAIDVYFHQSSDCSGSAARCTNLNPQICCPGNSPSVAYRGIPTNWHLGAQGNSGGGCSSPKWTADIRNTNFYCMTVNNRDNYTGSFYWFASRRREVEGSKNCTGYAKPDTLILPDGVTEFDIVGLDDEKVQELITLADSGISAEAFATEFQARRK